MKRVHIIISGKVIGVYFRRFIRINAEKLSVKGFAKNLDGRVEGVFEGEDKKVDKLLELCKKGPVGSVVEDVIVKKEDYKNEFSGFEVRY